MIFRKIKMFRLWITCLFLGMLVACECLENTKGVVLDKQTKKPLVKVKLYPVRRAHRQQITDSTGRFDISFISGFFEKHGCQGFMTLVFRKKGYDSLRVKIKNNRLDTVYLVPDKKTKD